jgi:hypothetical protein
MNLTKFFISICALLLTSCDTLFKDDSSLDDTISIATDKKIFIPAQPGTYIISLAASLQSSEPVRLVIKDNPRYGELKLIESKTAGLFEYTTPFVSSKGDKFSFAVLSQNGELIGQQEVGIFPVTNAQQLSCTSILAFTDSYTNIGTSGTVILDLLANDWICGDLLSDIELSITTAPAYGGIAEITSDKKMRYTIPANTTTQRFDKFTYQIRSKSNPEIVSQGAGYINFNTTCFFHPGNGFYKMPLIEAPSIQFTPLSNAILCGATISDVRFRIVDQPLFGTLALDDQKLVTYIPSSLTRDNNYDDFFSYEVCLPTGECKKSVVRLTLVANENCIEKANDDIYIVGTLPQYSVDVKYNDCDRELIQNIEIVTPPSHGRASVEITGDYVISANGNVWKPNQIISYLPDVTMGRDELTYKACFTDGSCSLAKARIVRIQ